MMEFNLLTFSKNIKLKTFLGIAGVLFLYKIALEPTRSVPFQVLGDLLTLLTIASLVIYFIEYLSNKTLNPLSLVMNLGIINVLLFCLITFSGSVFNMFFDNVAANVQAGKENTQQVVASQERTEAGRDIVTTTKQIEDSDGRAVTLLGSW